MMTTAFGTCPGAALQPAGRQGLARALRRGRAAPDPALSAWLDPEGVLRPEAGCLFGADVGGTKIQSVVTDLDGAVLAEARVETPTGGAAVLDQLRAHLDELGAGRAICAAGVGLPGAIRPATGHLERAPNLPGLGGRDLRAELEVRLGMPVAVENDVNLAALGESWLGAGAARPGGLAFIALGTGIGMGLARGDDLLRGARGAAGEIAFLPLGGDPFDPALRDCGALESVVSGAALVEDYRARGGRRPGNLRELTAAERWEPELEATMERLAERVALAVLSVEAVVDPGLFVFGGGIGSRPELIARIRRHLARASGEPPEIRGSALGNRAGVLGAVRAARLALADRLDAFD